MKFNTLLLLTALISSHGLDAYATEEETSTTTDNAYLKEITDACKAEAEGLDDKETYIQECIENMKKSFAQ